MPNLANQTPFAAQIAPSWDEFGADVVLVAVKATYVLQARPVPAATQLPVASAYAFVGDPTNTSLVAVPELTLPTGGTDVVLLGDAWAPGERPARFVDTCLSIAGRSKVLRVYGDRVWRSYALNLATRPTPFLRMPLTYERAYGGTMLDEHGRGSGYAANPIGCGHRGQRSRSAMNQTALPNVQPMAPERDRSGVPATAVGYGFVAPQWAPRSHYAGTYDAAWQQECAPFLPADFDRRFLRVGPADQYFDTALVGGETLALQHLAPQPWLQCQLPSHRFSVHCRGLVRPRTPLTLELVLIEPLAGRLTLLWRAAIPCDKRLHDLESLHVCAH